MATISEILLAQGRHAADSRRRQGENSGQMWGNLANIISQTGQSIQREREERPIRAQDAEMREMRIREGRASAQSAEREQIEDQQLRTLFAKPELPSPQELIATVGPERGTAIAKGLSALSPNPQQQYQDTQKTLRDVALGMHALPEALRAEYYPALRQNLVERQVIKPEDAPEQYDPQWWATTMSYGQEPPKQPALIQRDPTKDLSNPMTGEVVSKGTPEAPKPDARALNIQLADAIKGGDMQTASAIRRAIRESEAAGRNPNVGPSPTYGWAKDPTTGESRYATPDEIRRGGLVQPDTSDMRNKAAAKPVAARAVKAVRNLGAEIITKIGPAQRADAIKRGVEAVFGNDPKFRTYQDSRMALAGTLAVEQQGARISDADVRALWLPMVPDAYSDTSESNDLKWQLIDAMRGVEPEAGNGDTSSGLPSVGSTFQGGKVLKVEKVR